MLRKIGLLLLCAGGIVATPIFSMTEHLFMQGRPIEYALTPNDPQVFSNIFFWKIQAVCTILGESDGAPGTHISARMLRKSGTINDTRLATGDSIGLVVQPGDKLFITADSGAKVEMVNLGEETIIASCISTT